jgi:hypothetical protein
MTTCPACKGKDVRVGWPEAIPCAGRMDYSDLVPLTCKDCGHKWHLPYLPPPTEGERWDKEEARA